MSSGGVFYEVIEVSAMINLNYFQFISQAPNPDKPEIRITKSEFRNKSEIRMV